ncbi:MAG: CARDB domain-containing protein [Planctomycetota bacterium]
MAWQSCAAAAAAAGLAASCGGGGGGAPAVGAATGADLAAVEVVPAQIVLEAGSSLGVSVRVDNRGTESAGAFRVALHLSTDGTLDAADPRLLTWTVAGLAPGSSFTSSDIVQIPTSTPAGAYRLLLDADEDDRLAEPDEGNNVAASVELDVSDARLPDLVTDSVTFGPLAIEAGQTIDVDDTVRNAGIEASGSFRVGVYLSTDVTITAADVLVGHRQVLGLDPGASDSANGSLTIPMFVGAGAYYVGVLADDLAAVTEVDETNNGEVALDLLSVSAPPLPDLAPTVVAFAASTVEAGSDLVVEESVVNQGLAVAPVFQVGVYLSTDITIDPATDVLLGTRAVSGLSVGSSSASGAEALQVPGPTPAGEYFVGVVCDAAGLVPEFDEANNTLVASGRVTVTTPPLADLVARTFSFSPNAVDAGTGAVVTIQDEVDNVGQATSGSVRVAVYLSNDAAFSTNDILLGFHDLPALSVGSGTGRTIDLTVPGGIATGSYRVGLWVDDLNVEPELDEGNNLLVATGFLDVTDTGVAIPNLVSETMSPGQSLATPGETFQVVTRVANAGNASTTPFRVGVYLSTDAVVTTDDVLLGDRFVPFGLGAGFASVASAPVTIPASTPEGDYTIGVVADWQGVVDESDETDNVLAAAGTFRVFIPPPPRPNLVVSAVDVIEAGPFDAGEVFSVDHTVENTGEVDAAGFRVGIYLSTDDEIDAAEDVLLGSVVLPSLDVGSSERRVTSVQIPPGTATGSWRIGALVDDLDAVDENDEGDNDRLDPVTYVVQ